MVILVGVVLFLPDLLIVFILPAISSWLSLAFPVCILSQALPQPRNPSPQFEVGAFPYNCRALAELEPLNPKILKP